MLECLLGGFMGSSQEKSQLPDSPQALSWLRGQGLVFSFPVAVHDLVNSLALSKKPADKIPNGA